MCFRWSLGGARRRPHPGMSSVTYLERKRKSTGCKDLGATWPQRSLGIREPLAKVKVLSPHTNLCSTVARGSDRVGRAANKQQLALGTNSLQWRDQSLPSFMGNSSFKALSASGQAPEALLKTVGPDERERGQTSLLNVWGSPVLPPINLVSRDAKQGG